ERLYGWTRAEVLGKPIDDYLKTQFPQPFPDVRERLRKLSFEIVIDRLTQNFRSGPAVKALRALVPVSDPRVQIAHENRITGEIQEFGLLLHLRGAPLEFSSALAHTQLKFVVDLS